METNHRTIVGDSRNMSELEDNSVDLVVTSPPYPMIEMWDEIFTKLNSEIGEYLDDGKGRDAFDLMHSELEKTWKEVTRVLSDGGIACVNVGDATRKVDGCFRVYQNHARIIRDLENLGFVPLPDILWRKPVNSAAKFMGSGMLPPNAYATLEHEYILIFRNGRSQRSFEPGLKRRYNSAYFWEERNEWFSDVWMGIKGALQDLRSNELRERSAAFPLEIPYRLINMYSISDDTVLDPFWGTGTTSLAAMIAGRNSIGYEIEVEFTKLFEERVDDIASMSHNIVQERINDHENFVEEKQENGEELGYTAEIYDFPVMTKQEKQIEFQVVDGVERTGDNYSVSYEEYRDSSSMSLGKIPEQSTLGGDFN